MLELILGLLNDPEYRDKDVTPAICPLVADSTLEDFHQVLHLEDPRLDLLYSVRDGYEILSLERRGLLPFYADELRVIVSLADRSCQALVFRKTF